MAIFVDAQTDAADLASLVNDNGLFTTRYGDNPKKSWLYMQDEFDTLLAGFTTDGNNAIDDLNVFIDAAKVDIANDVTEVDNERISAIASIDSYLSAFDAYYQSAKGLLDDDVAAFTIDSNAALADFAQNSDDAFNQFDVTLEQYKESRGFNNKGAFAAGFTYELPNDVGIDASGNPWIYNGALPFTVTAGTTPTSPTYTQVVYGSAAQVSMNTTDTVQSFADSFALKIFQSPTDGGLTEIQTRTVNSGEVYEVRKTSDDSLTSIYSDAAGTTEILQNGVGNVSDSAGVVEFYVADGDYYVTVNSVRSDFLVSSRLTFDTVNEATSYSGVASSYNKIVTINSYDSSLGSVGFKAKVVLTSELDPLDIDAITSTANTDYSFLPVLSGQATVADIRAFGGGTGLSNAANTKSAFDKAVRFLARNGGGSLFLYPNVAGQDFYLSDEVSITYDNIKLHLYANLRLSWSDGTDPKSCVVFRGANTANSVIGAKVYGNGYIIDGNGLTQDANGYVFSAGEGFHSLFFKHCSNPTVEDVTLTNGLVDSGKALRCSRPTFKRVIFTGSVHDNGLSFSQDPDNYDPDDKGTWCNGVAENCEAYDNEDFGITSFNASGCLFVNPTSARNGTDSSPHGDNDSGHAGGGLSLEAQDNKRTACVVSGGYIKDNLTSGITITAKGCELLNVNVDGVSLNEAITNISLYRGHAVSLLGSDLKISGGSYKNSVRLGVYGLAAVLEAAGFVLIDNLSIEGNCVISGNSEGGIDARGVKNVSISEEVRVFENTSSNGQIYIHNNPGTTYNYNNGFGLVTIRAQVNSSSGPSVRVTNTKKADIKISGDSTVSDEPIVCNNVEKVVTVGNIITNETVNIPPNMILVTNCLNHFYWANKGDHTGGKAVNSSATNKFGESQSLGDAAGWADATAENKFNTLLNRLRDSGVLSI